jgi:hypothetical protein
MFRSYEQVFVSAVRLCALFSAIAGTVAAAQWVTHPDPGDLHPYAVCYTYNPRTSKVQYVLGYTSTFTKAEYFEPGTVGNFFTPGEADIGQPGTFYPGTDNDYSVISFNNDDSDFLIQVLDGSKLVLQLNNGIPPCRPPLFVPGPALAYTAAGTYPSQYLGSTSTLYGPTLTATALPLTNAAGIAVTNVHATSTPPSGYSNPADPSGSALTNQFFYADVTVAPGPPASTDLLVDLMSNGIQLALGSTPITFSGVAQDATGCPTDVTMKVQGTVAAARVIIGTSIWTQIVTFKNTSGQAINGPIQLALTNLSPNARLFTATGTGTCPSIASVPYITVTNGLPVNGIAAVVLTFTNSGIPSTAITYTPVIVAGGTRL